MRGGGAPGGASEKGWEVERGVLEAYLGFLLWKPEADGLAQQVPGSAGAPGSPP